MGLIDTHTHLESFARKGAPALDATLAQARAADVEALITVGTSSEDWTLYHDLSAAYAGFIHYTAGLHPCAVDETWERELGALPAFWNARVFPVALGEIGLDRFHLPKDPAEAARIFALQRAAFSAGLTLAKQLGCRVVIHSRGTFRDCVEMIDASGVDWTKVVFHCFTEGEAEMAELVRRGGYGSFTGVLTYKNADNVRAAAKAQGVERFMLETDAPYLTPIPHRGKPNEPAFIKHTAEFAAQLFDVSYDTLAATSTATAKKFFGV